MILIMFAVSPLASLVRLGILIYQYFTGEDMESTAYRIFTSSSNNLPTMTNFTIEDIMEVILSPSFSLGPIMQNPATVNPVMKMHTVHYDLNEVLPWFFIVFFVFTTVIIMAVANWTESSERFGMYPGEMAERDYKIKKFAKKVQRLISCLEEYQMELSVEDFVQPLEKNSDLAHNGSVTKSKETKILLPRPGEIRLSELKHEVDDFCPICLSNYEVGQNVVWSSNQECVHAFHYDCVVQWMKKRASGDCPCCRSPFVHKDVYIKNKKVHLQ